MIQFQFRGLELHNSRMWRWASVERVLDIMDRLDMNALIFHQNDLIDQLVRPKAYFSDELMWQRWPVRRTIIHTNILYLQQVIQKAKNLGIDFYIEVKEIWYHESLLEVVSGLRNSDGIVCPTNPFWFEFMEKKVEELLEALPDIAGIIVSPATRESKISISANPCNCERCRQTDPKEWYKQMLGAMYKPLAHYRKKLIVRDFSYTADQQNSVLDAAAEISKEIIVGLKNVPHDFWPTYPDNERIGHTGLKEFIEFDVWGQYCGLGVFPCSLIEDMVKRFRFCRERGATGVWFRTDWEILNEASVFNSFNLLNLFGGAMLAKNPDLNLEEIYRTWLEYGLFSSLRTESCTVEPVVPQATDSVDRLMKFMKASYSVIEKTIYIRGHVFQTSGRLPYSIDDIFAVMTKHHARDDWDPGASNQLDPTAENLEKIFAEKADAIKEVDRLAELLRPDSLGLPETMIEEIKTMLDLYSWYVRAFNYAARACFLTKRALQTVSDVDKSNAFKALEELIKFREQLIVRLSGTSYPFYVYFLLEEDRLRLLIADIKAKLSTIGK
jgi:hypothetical protein